MTKAEWELLRTFKRQLQFVSTVCAKLDKEGELAKHDRAAQQKQIKALEKTVSDMQEVVSDMEDYLNRRRLIQRIVKWLVVIVISAALTTFVNYEVSGYLAQPVTSTNRETEVTPHGDLG